MTKSTQKPEPEKCCNSCRQYKPESQMTKKIVRGYDDKKRSILRCNDCWAFRGVQR